MALDIAFDLFRYSEAKILDEKIVYLNSIEATFADTETYLEAARQNTERVIQIHTKFTDFNPNSYEIYLKMANLYKKQATGKKQMNIWKNL
jgi:tetratricopeptide (TPR) repeat protein